MPLNQLGHSALRGAILLVLATTHSAAPALAQNPAWGGHPPAAGVARLVRHYFKEPLPLVLDTGHVGVLAPGGFDLARLPPSLDPAGIEELGVPGWRMIRLRDAATPETIDALLEQLAAESGWDFVTPVFQDEFGPLFVTPQLLIRFAPQVARANAERVLDNSVPGAEFESDWAGMSGAYSVRMSERNGLKLLDTANRLARRLDVEFAEPDFLVTARLAQDPPNDPMLAFSWSLSSSGVFVFDTDFDLGIPGAWDVTQGDPGVRVAVLDCGIDPVHPDLNQDPGADFTGQGGGGAPVNACDNHGTLVAGCISAIADNALGSAGVAPHCRLVSARVMITKPSCGTDAWVQPSWVTNGLEWAVTNGIRITNASIGIVPSSAISAKYKSTHDQGVIHFAASLNDGVGVVAFPANLPSVIAVGATSPDGHRASWSNYGADLGFVAPGDLIRTTDRSGSAGLFAGDYAIVAGTSSASPMAAGVAALLRSVDPSLTPTEIEQLLIASARDLETPGWDQFTGWGMIRADGALAELSGAGLPDEFHTCESPSFSAGGQSVVFASHSPDLVPGDTNGKRDVFVRNTPIIIGDSMAGTVGSASVGLSGASASVGSGGLPVGAGTTGLVELISVNSSGEQGSDESAHPSVSADGRYVAFESWATNLVVGDADANTCRDVFVRDTLLGTTVRISVSTLGIEADGESKEPAISEDGRYVAFASLATNLDPATTSGAAQIYLRDMWAGTTTLVSRTSAGVAGNADSQYPSISGTGQRVVFFTLADNLVASNDWPNIVLADLPTASWTLVNVNTSGQSGIVALAGAVISSDGTRVAYTTESALSQNDTNGLFDVYVRDIEAMTTLPGSVDATGAFGSRESHAGALSSDGRFLVFTSAAPSFDAADTNGHVDVFRKDLQTGAIVRVSMGASGQQATAGCGHPWISPDGEQVGFTCRDDALTPGDALDGAADVYRRNIPAGTIVLLTPGS